MNVPLTTRYDPWGQEQKGLYGLLRLHLIAGGGPAAADISSSTGSATSGRQAGDGRNSGAPGRQGRQRRRSYASWP